MSPRPRVFSFLFAVALLTACSDSDTSDTDAKVSTADDKATAPLRRATGSMEGPRG